MPARTFVKAIVSESLPDHNGGAAAWRAILKSPGALLFQSGPESTGYPKDLNFPPVLNIRPLDLSLRLESRGPICPQGLQKTYKQASFRNEKPFGKSVDSGATPDSDFFVDSKAPQNDFCYIPFPQRVGRHLPPTPAWFNQAGKGDHESRMDSREPKPIVPTKGEA